MVKTKYKRNNIKGNLVEYAIPLAIVAIILGVGIYSFVTSGFLTNYFSSSLIGKEIGSTIVINKYSHREMARALSEILDRLV